MYLPSAGQGPLNVVEPSSSQLFQPCAPLAMGAAYAYGVSNFEIDANLDALAVDIFS